MSRSNSVLAILMIFCGLSIGDRLVSFLINRVPPFKVGECFKGNENSFFRFKVLDNHLINGYSDILLFDKSYSEIIQASFEELRTAKTEKVKCDE